MAFIVSEIGKATYINNPILVDFNLTTPNSTVLRYEMRITNAATQYIQYFKFSPDLDGQLTVDISAAVKTMFKAPKHNTGVGANENSGREVFNFLFTVVFRVPGFLQDQYSFSSVVNQVFFRGGKRGQHFNIPVIFNSILRSSDKIPVWSGYPALEYTAGNSFNIFQSIPSPAVTEQMKVKGCNPVYLKYMNSLGGYSFWLFEGENETTSTDNGGYSNSLTNVIDFGNSSEQEIELYSKVPARYHGLMLDLIDSPEIYIYNPTLVGEQYFRVVNSNNDMERGNFKKVYEVKFKFKRVTNYNAQILWQ